MGSKKWPQEAVDWLKENAKGKNTADITEQLNRQGFDVKYGIIFTESQVKAAKSRYKIKSGVAGGVPKGYSFKFPPGMEEYIRSIAKGRSVREIAGMVSEHFGIEFTASQCSGYKKAHNIRSGNKQTFPKGNIPHNKGKHMPPEIYEKCKQTMFIFSGSKRHLMSNMFNSSSKPFYQSAISIGLKPIPIHIYVEFANRLFEQRGKLIDKSVIEEVYRMFDGYTWFVQMIMNELFALTEEGERCSMDKIEIARKNVILTQESSYKDLLANLAPKQKLVLQAIAKEGRAEGLTSSAFIKKYKLPSASSVQSAVKPLLKNDLITQEDGFYRVYDYFFADWMARIY